MPETPPVDAPGSPCAGADAELARLRRAIDQARAELARLRADMVAAQTQFDGHAAARLLEANEQLVLSSLRVQAEADTAAEAAALTLREVARSAELDVLTGLPNRLLLLDRLTQAISGARRRGTRVAVLFLDLNNFKQVNDTLGHTVGDQVLRLAADRLATSVRAADTVSRYGGDEFVVLLGEVAQAQDAIAIADKLAAALCAPGHIGDQVIRLTASIGISLFPEDGEDASTLIERADAAMYRAKRYGLSSCVFQREPVAGAAGWPDPAPASLQPAVAASAHVPTGHESQRAQLQEANQNLVMAALTAQQLQATAEQARATQMQALITVVHELRSPLLPIRTAAALLRRDHADNALLQFVRDMIESQVGQMTRLVSDLLDVSRSHTGKFRLDRRPVDLAALIGRAVQAGRPAMEARQQHFDASVPAGPLLLDGDPVRLTQVLSNLLDNATKYTPAGGHIRLAVSATAAAVVLTVADNGIGISAEALPRVFDAFVQDEQAVAFNGAGLGIGLTVVRELVEAHGGCVVASSAGSGQGSQFVVTLPLLTEPGA